MKAKGLAGRASALPLFCAINGARRLAAASVAAVVLRAPGNMLGSLNKDDKRWR
jgi:hypothetical protein